VNHQSRADATPEVESLVLEDQVSHLLRRAHQRASAIFASAIEQTQLTPSQGFVLTRLAERGELSQNLLGRLSAMDPATVQGVTRRLIARGLIERRPDTADRRRLKLRLTTEGQKVAERIETAARAANEKVMAPLTPEERRAFLLLLRRLA